MNRCNGVLQIICARYNINPSNLHIICNGCLQTFYVNHALIRRNRGLVITRHNAIRDKIIHPDRQYLPPGYIHREPLIQQGHIIS